MLTKIEVTADDIINGDKNNCYACPVALAVKRKINTSSYIYTEAFIVVHRYNINIYNSDNSLSIHMPNNVINFIKDFDGEQKNLAPFSFELDIPEEFLVQ